MDNRKDTRKMIIFIGIQASGKSSFYHIYFPDYIHINLDELHTRKKEKQLIDECLAEGKDLVIDNTNPLKTDRERYIRPARDNGYEISAYYFESKIADCIGRNKQRTGKARIPDQAIAATYNKLQLPDYEEGFDWIYYVRMTDDGFEIKEWENEI